MAKSNVVVKDIRTLQNGIKNVNSYMVKLADELKSLSSNINAMMKGDKNGPYWNGEDAVAFYRIAKGNLTHDIENYTSARAKLEALGTIYELVAAGYKK